MPLPRVLSMCGLPFSGKSSLARALAARLDVTHLEVDAIMRERIGEDHGAISNQDWIATYREGERRLRELLADGHSVIYDGVHFRWAQREKLRRVASDYDASVLIVRVQTPLPVIRQRQARNMIRPSRPDVGAEVFADVLTRFQEVRDTEAAIFYDGSEPFETWFARTVPELAPSGSRSPLSASPCSPAADDS